MGLKFLLVSKNPLRPQFSCSQMTQEGRGVLPSTAGEGVIGGPGCGRAISLVGIAGGMFFIWGVCAVHPLSLEVV